MLVKILKLILHTHSKVTETTVTGNKELKGESEIHFPG